MNYFNRHSPTVVLAICGMYAFIAASSVVAAPPNVSGLSRLTNDKHLKRDPVVFDNGQQVIFSVLESPVQLRLMQLNLSDGTVTPVNPDASNSEFEPAVSSDGRYLAFVQSRGNLSLALVIRDRETKQNAEIKPGGGFSGLRSPAISPDNKRVLYCYPEDGRQHIFSVNMQAEDRQQLTNSIGVNNWPSFSPDGKQIVFGSTRDGNYEIYLMNANGLNVRRLTDNPFQDIRPEFSPDGKRIAFTSSRDGNYEIYVMNADGSNVSRVTDNPERDDYPVWHPDGKRLVIVAEREGQHDLYLINVP